MADQFVVTFDGHLYELPGPCPLLLAQDVSTDPSFTLLLSSDSQNLLLIEMNNSTINIQHGGQVIELINSLKNTLNAVQKDKYITGFPFYSLHDTWGLFLVK